MNEHNHKATCEIIRSFLFGLNINVSLWFISRRRRGRRFLFTFPMKNVNARIQIIFEYSMTMWILHYIKIIIYIFFPFPCILSQIFESFALVVSLLLKNIHFQRSIINHTQDSQRAVGIIVGYVCIDGGYAGKRERERRRDEERRSK